MPPSPYQSVEELKPGALGPDAVYPVTEEQWRDPPDGLYRKSMTRWLIHFHDGSETKIVEDRPYMQIQGNAAVFARSEYNDELRDRLVVPLGRVDQIQEVITRYLDPTPSRFRR